MTNTQYKKLRIECYYAKCFYAGCRNGILNVMTLSVVMLNIMAPLEYLFADAGGSNIIRLPIFMHNVALALLANIILGL
jgi:hypothetical protein